jgi:SAM-dependent methyltransferase
VTSSGEHVYDQGQKSEADHAAYFDEQIASTREFWRRFGRRPEFQGRRVVDIGCGHGAMSVDAANSGGDVLGLDLDPARIRWAIEHVQGTNATGSLRFSTQDLADLDDGSFDLAISKDTFEHVEDVPALLGAIRRVLVPNGELWAGFSPLYWSPYGDHGRTATGGLPWAHTLFGTGRALQAITARRLGTPKTLRDLGLNGMKPKEWRRYVAEAGLEVADVRHNQGDKRMMRTMVRLRVFPPTEHLFTVGIYTVLRRS